MTEEQRIIKAVKKVTPAVVSIVMSKTLEEGVSPTLPFTMGPAQLDALQPPQDGQPPKQPPQEVNVSGGSGFFVSSDGLVLTNRHVVQDPKAHYTVITNDDQRLEARVVARDSLNDVALLKVAIKDAPTIPLGNSKKLALGQTVITIGNALGMFQNTVSRGVVSGLSRTIAAANDVSGETSQLRGLIQTDAAINPGNSGGPLIDLEGQTVGINTAVVFGAENIGFAIPIDSARRDLETLKKYGEITHPSLGIRYVSITPSLQERFKLAADRGAWVIREATPWDVAVLPGGPADQAGIKENDIILEYDGEPLNEKNALIDYVERSKIGQVVTLTVLSEGRRREVNVTLAKRE